MKNVIFVSILSVLALASCSKDETLSSSVTAEEISVSATPSQITTYISENYPDASIAAVYKLSNSDATYSVTLSTSELLAFNSKYSLVSESLTDTICDSLSYRGRHGRHHGGGHHGGGHSGGGISADSIPSAITEYVTANFAGYSIHNAMYDTLCQFGIVFNVMIDSAHSEHAKLIFDASGLYLAKASRLKSADLPEIITTAVTNQYATYSLRNKAEMLTLADGSIQYKVYLYLHDTKLKVVFTSDGTVICEE